MNRRRDRHDLGFGNIHHDHLVVGRGNRRRGHHGLDLGSIHHGHRDSGHVNRHRDHHDLDLGNIHHGHRDLGLENIHHDHLVVGRGNRRRGHHGLDLGSIHHDHRHALVRANRPRGHLVTHLVIRHETDAAPLPRRFLNDIVLSAHFDHRTKIEETLHDQPSEDPCFAGALEHLLGDHSQPCNSIRLHAVVEAATPSLREVRVRPQSPSCDQYPYTGHSPDQQAEPSWLAPLRDQYFGTSERSSNKPAHPA